MFFRKDTYGISKRKVLKIWVSIFLLTVCFFLLLLFHPREKMGSNEMTLLLRETKKFNAFLKKGDAKSIYDLFNETFKREIPFEKFALSFNHWIADKKGKRVETRFINITGLFGQVSTWIWEDKRRYHYLFHNWIKTDSGWRLQWLSKILNEDFDYGRRDTVLGKELLKLAVEKAISLNGFKEKFPHFVIPRNIVFLKKGRPEEGSLSFPKFRVLWLTLEEIRKKHRLLSIPVYFDFGAIRIIDNIATVYLDIIPIQSEKIEKRYRRRIRGLQFQFKRENGRWNFISYGAKW